jgi:hypothetical protein
MSFAGRQLRQICAFWRVTDYISHMGILLTIAGLVIALYTFSSVVGLWLAYQVMDAAEQGEAIPEALAEADDHHIELMARYALGWRRHVWAGSIVALFTTLLAMLIQSHLAFWALGVAIAIDTALFLTYSGNEEFLVQSSLQERILDGVQSMALLAAFALLLWVNLRAGEILG